MSDLTLQVVWPIHDDAMYDTEAIALAWEQWPAFAEAEQVTVVGTPKIRIAPIAAPHQEEMQATRAVVCSAPVIKRSVTAGRRT